MPSMTTRLPRRWPAYPKPHIYPRAGGYAVRNIRGSIFYFDNLDYMRKRWGLISPYHEGSKPSDLSDHIHPDLPEAGGIVMTNDPVPAHSDAYNLGFQACLDGEPSRANPYRADDPRYDDWLDGWDDAYVDFTR